MRGGGIRISRNRGLTKMMKQAPSPGRQKEGATEARFCLTRKRSRYFYSINASKKTMNESKVLYIKEEAANANQLEGVFL